MKWFVGITFLIRKLLVVCNYIYTKADLYMIFSFVQILWPNYIITTILLRNLTVNCNLSENTCSNQLQKTAENNLSPEENKFCKNPLPSERLRKFGAKGRSVSHVGEYIAVIGLCSSYSEQLEKFSKLPSIFMNRLLCSGVCQLVSQNNNTPGEYTYRFAHYRLCLHVVIYWITCRMLVCNIET